MPRQFIKYTGFLFLVLFSSCGLNYMYNENVTIADRIWVKDQAAHFDVLIEDSLTPRDFYITLRNDTEYRFSNLFIFLTTHFPNGNVTRDTIEFVMADNAGKWLGKGWGNLKENKILLKQGLSFPVTGHYQFYVQQAMRADTLEGIHSVGLIIEKAE